METAEMLREIDQIGRLKSNYFYFLDTKQWNRWRDEVFTADALMSLPGTELELVGREAIIDFVAKALDGVVSVHHGHQPVIDIEGPASAKGRWAMEDVLLFPKDHHSGTNGRVHGYGFYHEDYVRQAGGWRIARLVLTRLHFGPL